jgi:hypothetical protein
VPSCFSFVSSPGQESLLTKGALAAIEPDKAAGKIANRPLVDADFRRRAMMLPEAARYDVILELRKDGNLVQALTAAMKAIEVYFPPLAGQLPKDHSRFEVELLAGPIHWPRHSLQAVLLPLPISR